METIKINGIDITDLIMSFQEYDEISPDSDSNSIIGNTVSRQIKLTIKNTSIQLKDLLDSQVQIGDEIFLIYEKPEKWTKEISLTLYDKMILFNVAYKSTLDETATISEQLDEMSSLAGVTIDKASLSEEVLNKISSWYDNTVIMRNYLGFIAQCDGKNAYIENNQVIFKKIAVTEHECDFCSDYELVENITYTRVCFDNGVTEPLEKGLPTGHTLYVSPNNSYIDQFDIDRIYEMYHDLSFYSFKKFNTFEVDNLNLTDLITYDGFTIMPLSMKRTVNGGEALDTLELEGEITIKNADSILVKDDPNNRIRRVQASIDQLEGRYSVLAQDVDENTSKIGNLELTTEEFKTEITNIKTEVDTSIAVTEVQSEYGLSDNEETSPDKWSDAIPEEIENSKYLWMRDAVTYTNGLIMYLNLRMLSKQTADKRIISITPYYIVTDSDTVVPSSGWQEKQPEWTFDMFLWQKERVSYSDNSFIETSPRCTPMKMKLEDVDAQLNSLVIEMSTALKQVAEGIEISREKVDSLGESIKEWARFNGAELELGMTNSQFKAILSNSELAFWQGDTKVAWLSNHELHIESAVIGKSLGVGKLRLVVENDPNDGFSFIIMNQEA